MSFLILSLLMGAPAYEGYMTFTGLKGPKVIIIKECVLKEEDSKIKFETFCENTKPLLNSYVKFCLKVSNKSKEVCEQTLKQNAKSYRLKGKVITWFESRRGSNDSSREISPRQQSYSYECTSKF